MNNGTLPNFHIPHLRGAQPTMLLALLHKGGPLTRQGFEALTGYSRKNVARTVTTMVMAGLLELDEVNKTYWLSANALEQLPAVQAGPGVLARHKSPTAMSSAVEAAVPAGISGAQMTETGTQMTIEPQSIPTAVRDKGAQTVASGPQMAARAQSSGVAADTEGAQLAATAPQMTTRDVTRAGRQMAESGPFTSQSGPQMTESGTNPSQNEPNPSPSRARVFTTTTTTSASTDVSEAVVVSSKQAARARPAPPDEVQPGANESRQDEALEVAHWLGHGGVGRGSPKFRQLLRRGLDPEVVKAHVLERLYVTRVEQSQAYTVGLLIKKLEDGDPPPPMRCPKCLHRPNRANLCRCLDNLPNVRR